MGTPDATSASSRTTSSGLPICLPASSTWVGGRRGSGHAHGMHDSQYGTRQEVQRRQHAAQTACSARRPAAGRQAADQGPHLAAVRLGVQPAWQLCRPVGVEGQGGEPLASSQPQARLAQALVGLEALRHGKGEAVGHGGHQALYLLLAGVDGQVLEGGQAKEVHLGRRAQMGADGVGHDPRESAAAVSRRGHHAAHVVRQAGLGARHVARLAGGGEVPGIGVGGACAGGGGMGEVMAQRPGECVNFGPWVMRGAIAGACPG
jgi:hypothetical protein